MKYEHAAAYEKINLSSLMEAIASGLVLVDFDAWIRPSGAVRDHGTKFRVKPDDIGRLHEKRTKMI